MTSGGYGYTVGALDRVRLRPGGQAPSPDSPVEIEIFGEWVDGEVAQEPLYDPEGLNVRSLARRSN